MRCQWCRHDFEPPIEELAESNVVCPNCGEKLRHKTTTAEYARSLSANAPTKPPSKGLSWGMAVLIVAGTFIVALPFLPFLADMMKQHREEERKIDLQIRAKETAIEAVRQKLLAPATAQFSGIKVQDDGGLLRVSGSVDAQNTFGALIRNRFVVEMDNSCIVINVRLLPRR